MSTKTNAWWKWLAETKVFEGKVSDPELVGVHSGQKDLVIYAFAPDGTQIGKLDYTIYADELHIRFVDVSHKFRRQGVATALYEKMLAEHPGMVLQNAGRTHDGFAFRQAFDKDHQDRLPKAQTPPEEIPQKQWDSVIRLRQHAVATHGPDSKRVKDLDALIEKMNRYDNDVLHWRPGDDLPTPP